MQDSAFTTTISNLLGLPLEELAQIKQRYPFFAAAKSSYAKKLTPQSNSYDAALSDAALQTTNRAGLRHFLQQKPPTTTIDWAETNPAAPAILHEVAIAPIVETTIEMPATIVYEYVPNELKPTSVITPIKESRPEIQTPQTIEPIHATETAKQASPIRDMGFLRSNHTFDEWLAAFKNEKKTPLKALNKEQTELADQELNRLIETNIPAAILTEAVHTERNYSKGLDSFIEKQKQKACGKKLKML